MTTRSLPSWLPFACVGVGAAVGTGARAAAEHVWPSAPGQWPWTTLIINVVGAFLLGWLQERLARGTPARWRSLVKLGVGTGVLGGFTTYSTFVMEALQSMQAEAVALAFGYLAASVVLGVVSARLGLALGGARRPGPGTDGAGPSAADHPTSGMDLGGDAR